MELEYVVVIKIPVTYVCYSIQGPVPFVCFLFVTEPATAQHSTTQASKRVFDLLFILLGLIELLTDTVLRQID